MMACESFIDRSAKVRYLSEKGADCRAKDHVRYPLFAKLSINKLAFFLFSLGRRLCFMRPISTHSGQMT